MPNMQVLCPYYMYVKDHMKAMLQKWQMCGFISQFELSETILKQLITHLFHTLFNTVISL